MGWHIKEPDLVFGRSNHCPDPKLGITTYGPYRTKEGSYDITDIKIGVIGDRTTIDLVHTFLDMSERGISASDKKPLEWAELPPLKHSSAWSLSLERRPDRMDKSITNKEKKRTFSISEEGRRISRMCNLIVDKIEDIKHSGEPEPDVMIFGVPRDVNKHCGLNLSKRDINITKDFATDPNNDQKTLSEFVENTKSTNEAKSVALDLRAAIKARAMGTDIPIQIISQNVLEQIVNDKGPEANSKIAWNIWSAIYYKAGAYPWRLPERDLRTCYVGVSFYKEEKIPNNPLKSAMAQIFLPNGNTVVVKGLPVRDNSKDNRRTEIGRAGVETLLNKIKKNYRRIVGHLPNRIVFHKTSSFSQEEQNWVLDNLGGIDKFDLLHIHRDSKVNLFRKHEKKSVLRGTATKLSKDRILLYTTGRKPYYGVYDGFRIPNPLTIDRDAGDSSFRKLTREIMELSKVDYNNAKFSQRNPFTITFAKKAGKVFKEIDPENQGEIKSKYRFYM